MIFQIRSFAMCIFVFFILTVGWGLQSLESTQEFNHFCRYHYLKIIIASIIYLNSAISTADAINSFNNMKHNL